MAIEKQSILFVVLCFCLISSFSQTVQDLRPTVTMKEYVDMQMQLNKEYTLKIMDIQNGNITNNVANATAAIEKRFDGVNEFRSQLKDQAGTFVTRNELWTAVIGIIGVIFAALSYMKKSQSIKI